jgi:hypothetical protein
MRSCSINARPACTMHLTAASFLSSSPQKIDTVRKRDNGVPTGICAPQIYGKDDVFDVERLIDLLSAFETFREASQSARGNLDASGVAAAATPAPNSGRAASGPASSSSPAGPNIFDPISWFPPPPSGMPVPAFGLQGSLPTPFPFGDLPAFGMQSSVINSPAENQGAAIARYAVTDPARYGQQLSALYVNLSCF